MPKTSSTVVTVAFTAAAVVKALFVVSCLLQYVLLSRFSFTTEEAAANDLRQGALALASPAVALTAIVILFVWLYRAKKRVVALGMEGGEYSPGLTVGAFFIPFLNLGLPFCAVRELWRASRNPRGWRDQSSHPLVGWWWASWLANSLLPFALIAVPAFATGREALKLSTVGLAASAMLGIVCFLLTLFMVAEIAKQIEASAATAGVVETKPPALPPLPAEPLVPPT